MRKIDIENYDITNLEKYYFESKSLESLFAVLVNNGLTDTDYFKKHTEEYAKVFELYQKEKEKFGREFAYSHQEPSDKMWEIDFDNKQLIFHD